MSTLNNTENNITNSSLKDASQAADGRPDEVGGAGSATHIAAFWHTAVARLGLLDTSLVAGGVVPPAWAFADNAALANELLALVLSGRKTATAGALWEHGPEHGQEHQQSDPLPKVGQVSILLDGCGEPQAVIRTASVEVLPFNEVSAEHACCEGEGDRTLESWRRDHEIFWRRSLSSLTPPREFADDMPVVCERFELLFPRAP